MRVAGVEEKAAKPISKLSRHPQEYWSGTEQEGVG